MNNISPCVVFPSLVLFGLMLSAAGRASEPPKGFRAELLLEYKTVAGADSGIYLRGTPQVQIWDWNQVFNPKQPTRKPYLGSGGLFNNAPGTAARDPSALADHPFGEWNQFRIRQIGKALTLHASFDKGLDADFSRADKKAYVPQGKTLVPAQPNQEVKLAADAGRFGGALYFPKKGTYRPSFKDGGVLGYNAKSWSASVSVWLRLNPDEDLEPGYCDPIQIVGNDSKKGYIFLEWSKDERPRLFRYAIRPLFHIWNPQNRQWHEIPADKKPAVEVARAPFSREKWTHVVFTLENINDKNKPPLGRLYLNGKLQGVIEKWDMTFDWDPAKVLLVLGASYVGHIDDLAVFDRPLTDVEVDRIYGLKNGVRELYRMPPDGR